MARLIPISRIESDSEYGQMAAGLMLQHSPFIRWLDNRSGFEVDATDYDWLPADDTANMQARGRGGGFTEESIAPGSKQTDSLKIHGDKIAIDETDLADIRLGLRDMDSHFRKKIIRRVRDFARDYEALMFNGDGTGNNLKGLETIFDGSADLPGLGITGVINAKDASQDSSPTSLDLGLTDNADNQQAFMEFMSQWLAEVPNAKGIVCNRKFQGRITTIAHLHRNISITPAQGFGQIVSIDGVPLVPILDTAISNTEPDDAEPVVNNTTSIWLLDPGEMKFSLVTNSGLFWKDHDWEDKESDGWMWEIRAAWKVEEFEVARRVRNIKL